MESDYGRDISILNYTNYLASLEPLVPRIQDKDVKYLIDILETRQKATLAAIAAGSTEISSGTISILPMAIRSVILNVTATPSIAHILAESILPGLYTGRNTALLIGKNSEYSLDSMEILTDLIKRFGSSISGNEVANIENVLLNIISNEQGIIKKRAVTAMGLLARYLTGKSWDKLTEYLITGLDDTSDLNKLRSLIQLAGILARAEPSRFKNDLQPVIDMIIKNGLRVNEEEFEGKAKHESFDSDEEEEEQEEDDDPELLEVREASLSSLEIIVGLGYSAIENQFSDILLTSSHFIKFNPNYIVEDEEDEEDETEEEEKHYENDIEMGDGDSEDEFDLSEEEAFSDDDDQSWKLRRHAAKLAAALAISIPIQLPRIYSELLPPLTSMYSSEREQTVKAEIINSLIIFFQAASDNGFYYTSKLGGSRDSSNRRSSDVSMATESDPKTLLKRAYLSKLIKISLHELQNSTNISNLQNILSGILSNLVKILHYLPPNWINKIVHSLTILSKSKPALMTDILQLIANLFKSQNVQELTNHLPQLLQMVVLGINDKYYKVSGVALDGVLDLISIYSSDEFDADLSMLLPGIMEKAKSSSLDLETRDKAVKALGQFISKNKLSDENAQSGSDLIHELLSNEGLRITAIEATSVIAKGNTSNQFSTNWIVSSVQTLSSFLNQSSRTLRIGSLNAILSITGQSAFSSNQGALQALTTVCQIILNHGRSIITSTSPDGTALDIVGKILTNLVSLISISEVSEFGIQVINQISSQIASQVSDSILGLFGAVVQHSDDSHINAIYNELSKPRQVISSSSGTVHSNSQNTELAAKALAVVITEGHLADKIPSYDVAVKQTGDDFKWSLLVLGHIGRLVTHTASLQPLYSELDSTIRDESTKVIVANTIGQIISNNVDSYLPDLLRRLQAVVANSTHLYLIIIREVVSSSKQQDAEKYATEIWTSLFISLETTSAITNTRRRSHATSTAAAGTAPVSAESNVVGGGDLILAECLGRLSILNPQLFLPQLQVHLTSDKPSVRVTVLSAVKFTFGQSHDSYDDLLRPIVADFLALVDDDDVDIRQVALSALVSAIHNKSHLLLPHLSRLLPLLYRETTINKALIHTVQMGPFKHKVDDGLDLRKTAYETIYTLVSTLSAERLQSVGMIDELLDQVVLGSGLSDEHDIKVLSCVIIGRLASTCLSNVTASGRLHQIITRYSALLNVVVKENAIKQEFEKHNEIVRNIERSSIQINDAIISDIAKGDATDLPSDLELGEWEYFFKTNIANNKFS